SCWRPLRVWAADGRASPSSDADSRMCSERHTLLMSALPDLPDPPRRLGEMLMLREAVRAADLERALELQAAMGGRLGHLLIRIGAISEDQLLEVLAEQLQLPVLGREVAPPSNPPEWSFPYSESLPPEWMLDQQVLLWADGDALYCASPDPLAPGLQTALAYAMPGATSHPVLPSGQLLERALDLLPQRRRDAVSGDDIRHLRELAAAAPVVELVNGLMSQAVEQRASDIHLEPGEHQFAVRFRIDGVLYSRLTLPRDRYNAVASRL